MNFLLITLAVLLSLSLIILFMLFSPLSVRIVSKDSLSVYAGLSFIRIKLHPKKQKKQSRKKKPSAVKDQTAKQSEKEKKAEKSDRKEPYGKHLSESAFSKGKSEKSSVSDTLDFINEILANAAELIGKKASITLRSLVVTVSRPEAADTAVQFGICCGIVSSILALTDIFYKAKISSENVRVVPDFVTGKSSVMADITISASVLSILICILKAYLYKTSSRKDGRKNDK